MGLAWWWRYWLEGGTRVPWRVKGVQLRPLDSGLWWQRKKLASLQVFAPRCVGRRMNFNHITPAKPGARVAGWVSDQVLGSPFPIPLSTDRLSCPSRPGVPSLSSYHLVLGPERGWIPEETRNQGTTSSTADGSHCLSPDQKSPVSRNSSIHVALQKATFEPPIPCAPSRARERHNVHPICLLLPLSPIQTTFLNALLRRSPCLPAPVRTLSNSPSLQSRAGCLSVSRLLNERPSREFCYCGHHHQLFSSLSPRHFPNPPTALLSLRPSSSNGPEGRRSSEVTRWASPSWDLPRLAALELSLSGYRRAGPSTTTLRYMPTTHDSRES
jgi:hypothetical protein